MQTNTSLKDKTAINVFINVLDSIKKDMNQSSFDNYHSIKLLFIKQFNYDIIGIMDGWLKKEYDEFIFAIERDSYKNKIHYSYSNSFINIGFGYNGKTITISFFPSKKSNHEWDMRFARTLEPFLKRLNEYGYRLKTDIDDYHLENIEDINQFIKEVKDVNSSS